MLNIVRFRKDFCLVEVSREYKLVVSLKEFYKVNTIASSIFFDGDFQTLFPDAIIREMGL